MELDSSHKWERVSHSYLALKYVLNLDLNVGVPGVLGTHIKQNRGTVHEDVLYDHYMCVTICI